MPRLYSKRLLLPYIGVVQVAELDWARALSLDGRHWAIRYAKDEVEKIRNSPLKYDPRVNCSLVVTIDGERVRNRITNRYLDPEQAQADSQRLYEAIADTRVPFAVADRYEYWLLDGRDERPLALLHSCVDEEEMQLPVPEPEWQAIPAMGLEVPDPDAAQGDDHPQPVNYRLERLVEERAGYKPKTAWFRRTEGDSRDFPPLLLREDWENEEGQRLCELYLWRLAPRLLMLQGLSESTRSWLEQAAREYALDVERFYPLYPEVVDRNLMNAARVEARLRRAAQA
jgi:hypothetical protein